MNSESTILIVDDNPETITLISRFLKQPNFYFLKANNAEEAYKVIQEKVPDLILLDVIMPKTNGIDMCIELKKNELTQDIPVIFVTGLSDGWNKKMAFDVGAVDYIVKPILKEELICRVDTHLKLKKAMEKLEQMVVTDELTGAYNRRFAYEVLAKQMETAQRSKESFVVCYLDIDKLKQMNDQFGHEQGDELIKTVVNFLNHFIRKSDYLFRMGGDEFLLLLPRMEIQDAKLFLERLRNDLNKESIQNVVADFSFGFSEYRSGDEHTVSELIQKADSDMYNDKKRKKGILL
ncbi:MAG: diguanylate cyclase [Leptospiraceae bacterium]|nr:diguanylate cyclase [Leptospiraceae bacterium]